MDFFRFFRVCDEEGGGGWVFNFAIRGMPERILAIYLMEVEDRLLQFWNCREIERLAVMKQSIDWRLFRRLNKRKIK